MHKVRPAYPPLLRSFLLVAVFSLIVLAIMWGITISQISVPTWLSLTIGVAVASIVCATSIITVVQNFRPMKFNFNGQSVQISDGRVIPFEDILYVQSKLDTPKFVFGASLYELEFRFGHKEAEKFSIVDTRMFFRPTISGYSEDEIATIIRFFDEAGFSGNDRIAVDRLAERLQIKN